MTSSNGTYPNSEVQPKLDRRKFDAEYKRRILREADECDSGGIGALLRREGLYSSHLVRWRAERARGEMSGLMPRTRGRKPDPEATAQIEIARLKRENERLSKDLEQARALIDLQKKLADLLGMTLALPSPPNATHV